MKTFLEWLGLKENTAVAEPPAQDQKPTQQPQGFVAGKLVVYPDMQGAYIGDNVKGSPANLKVVDCIGNEPNKDFNYFKTGSGDKGPMNTYVSKMIAHAREKGTKSLPPVMAIKHPILPGKYLVIDGNHRLAAFKIGGMPDINAVVVADQDIILATPGTRWQQGITPQTIAMDQARNNKVDLKTYFNTKELAVPQNDEWVASLRMPMQNN